MSRVVLIFGLIACSVASIKDDDRLGLDVRRHQPCPADGGWKPTIVLADDSAAPLKQDPKRPGCYSLTGDLKVNKKVSSNLQVYVELRTEASTAKRPQPCQGSDANGCGGYGSCVYCGDCTSLHSKDAKIAEIALKQNGKPISCDHSNLEPGVHENVELTFCMPKFKEFLDAFDLDRQTFDDLLGHTNKQSLYMWVYIFDANEHNVARLARIDNYQLDGLRDRQYAKDLAAFQEQQTIAIATGQPAPKTPHKRPYELSQQEYERTNMQKSLSNNEYVACHRIMATLFYDNEDAARISSVRQNYQERTSGGARAQKD